jgi:adenosylcobinamide-phosphate synthase
VRGLGASARYDARMSFFAIFFALLLEQLRPLAPDNPIHASVSSWVRWVGRNFDAGGSHHGWVSWGLAVGAPTIGALGVHWLLAAWAGWPFAALWSAAVLYFTLGFRQFSHHFTGIRDALDAGDEARARDLLGQWRHIDASDLPRSELVRHVIEHSVLAAHRHVFGVLAWFSVLAAFGLGPAGAVLYRTSEYVSRYWRHRNRIEHQPASEALQTAAVGAWKLIDWLPARITALGFAVVGSFEEAIDSWRNFSQRIPDDNDGVIVAATAGAINVRLGGEAVKAFAPAMAGDDLEADALQAPPGAAAGAAAGREPEPAHLAQVVGLVWRSVVMWLVLLALLTLARLLG